MTRQLLLMICAGAAGCAALQASAPPPRQLDGALTRAAFAQQVLDPDTSRRRESTSGQDARSAAAAQQRYQKSFAEPVQQTGAFTVGVTGQK
jgi:hypothetical protein